MTLERFAADPDDVREAVVGCGMFASLEPPVLDELIAEFEGVRLPTGTMLLREGDPADAMYVVRHGRLRATVTSDGGEPVVLGQVGKHEVVGEMAVITDQPRAATVTAMRDTELFELPAAAYGALIQRHPTMLRPFAGVVVDRLRTALTTPKHAPLPATIVVLPLGTDDGVEFAHELAGALHSYSVAVLTADDAEGRDHPAAWLLDIENDVDISILIADRTPTEWTRLCLRHADHVELVVDDRAAPTRSAVEDDPSCVARLAEVPVHLISLYDERPATSRWLGTSDVATFTNVRRDSSDDMARLARLISGSGSIVVLGGGGARGFAHFGVVRALREAGVPIDGIIGTSAGAVVGGLLARDHDTLAAQRQMLAWFESVRWRRDMNPPRIAITSGRTMTIGLQELGAGYLIEDLPISFAAISCDLVAGEPFVHARGPLWQAIRASGSVPGLFPPVRVGGRLLVDGGLVANMPTEIARGRHPNARLIAVDVGDPTGIVTGGTTTDGVLNGWQQFRRRPTTDTVTLSRLLMRLTELGRNDSTDFADVTITPDVRGFGITDTAHAAEIIARGHAAGRDAVESGLVTAEP